MKLINDDCMNVLSMMDDNSVDFTLTDIPYDAVNRTSNGLRCLDKGTADELNFNLADFLDNILRVTKNSICIFCGKEQFSTIFSFFSLQPGTVRPIVWHKSNPSPMNGQYVYLSGVELGVWFKKKGAFTFNAHCKNTVFKYPNGSSKIHPTEKNHHLLEELILDNTHAGDIVFDPCMGSGSTGYVALQQSRDFIGIEINKDWYNKSVTRLNNL